MGVQKVKGEEHERCPHCGYFIFENEDFCRRCGEAVERKPPTKKKWPDAGEYG